MKKKNVLYVGDLTESLWAALGYMPLFFIITMTMDRNSIFLKAHGIRSAVIFLFFIVLNIPVILIHGHILPTLAIIYPIYKIVSFVLSFWILFEYCACVKQAANKIYKKTFLIDKLFGEFFNNYIRRSFFGNIDDDE